MKKKLVSIEHEELFDMIEDILIYLETGNEDECVTNEYKIGIRCLFRGGACSKKIGRGDFSSKKYEMLN